MSDSHEDLESVRKLNFSGEQGFFDTSLVIRYLILVFLALSLFAFLHFREVYVEVLDLNSYAPNYIVSQVDFDFADDEATIILKQEAVRNIGKIYQLSEKEVGQKRIEFDNLLFYNPSWREQGKQAIFDELYQGAESMEKILLDLRLTDAATIKKMEEVDIPTDNYLPFTMSFLNKQPSTLPASVWDNILQKYFRKDVYSPISIDVMREFFINTHWQLEEDIPAQKALRKKIQSMVPEKYSHVTAGRRIIDQGERVTSRHLAMIQAMKEAMGESRNLFHPLTLLGTFIKTFLFIGIAIAYLKLNFSWILTSNRKLFLLVTIVVMTFIISKLTEYLLLKSQNHLIEVFRYPLFVPLAAILICSLIHPAIATFISGFLVVIMTLSLAFEPEPFLLANFIAALVVIVSIHSLRKRKEIFVVCFKAWLATIAVILSLHLYENKFWELSLLTDVLSSALFLLITAVLVVGLLPLLESGFKILTDATLMEYMDPNNEILRRLSLEAPGTYQHSVVVGNLAERAALAIGANGLFCRVATLYHDIGKVITPGYFTENQMGDVDMHQLLTPHESAQVIMAHVPEGVAMAREGGIPEPIIDVIKEHHGTSLVYYFFRKEVERLGGDASRVEQRDFRYAGPKPHSKESGIIMITDSFEAASRSLDEINEESLTDLINRIVRIKIEDGQLDDCSLTFEELSTVKKALVKTLLAAGHTRVKYPAGDKSTSSSIVEASA